MTTLYEYIIKPHGERYNSVKQIEGKELILNTRIDEGDFKFTNRIGEVVGVPKKEGVLKKGDLVIVHHNTFRRWYNVRKKLKDSSNLIKDGLFSADLDMIFAYNRGEGWVVLEDYVFIKPIEKKSDWTKQLYEPFVGTVKFNNPLLEMQGVEVGDKVTFEHNCEYKFNIDDEVLYKMSVKNVKCIIDGYKEENRFA